MKHSRNFPLFLHESVNLQAILFFAVAFVQVSGGLHKVTVINIFYRCSNSFMIFLRTASSWLTIIEHLAEVLMKSLLITFTT